MPQCLVDLSTPVDDMLDQLPHSHGLQPKLRPTVTADSVRFEPNLCERKMKLAFVAAAYRFALNDMAPARVGDPKAEAGFSVASVSANTRHAIDDSSHENLHRTHKNNDEGDGVWARTATRAHGQGWWLGHACKDRDEGKVRVRWRWRWRGRATVNHERVNTAGWFRGRQLTIASPHGRQHNKRRGEGRWGEGDESHDGE